jgi:hypothetical protein|tara:strand:+ start:148 stop:702 length:555 start_codon:yes stop_codon:yes gene_type:complete
MELYKTKRPKRLPKNNHTYFYSVQFPRANSPANEKVLIVPFRGFTYYDVKEFYELQSECGALLKYGIGKGLSCRVKRIDGEEVKASLDSEIVAEKLRNLTNDFDALNKLIPKEIKKADLSLWFDYEESRREEHSEDLFQEIPLEQLSEEKFFMKTIEQNYPGLAKTINKDYKKFRKNKPTIGLV